ncbi:MAG: ACT domain-containing protein [Clostridiales bacterium]|nr:ACT domain-containing protein [Clostridiales bacterium]
MAIKQLTVFVQNSKGTIVSVTDTLAKNNINIRALSIAETEDFGILRLIVNDTEGATKILNESGYLIKTIDVIGVKIGDNPGELTSALAVLDKANINVEYLYAFMARTEKHAYVVLRVEDNACAENALMVTTSASEIITLSLFMNFIFLFLLIYTKLSKI